MSKRPSRGWIPGLLVVVLLFTATMLTLVMTAIWPGEAKLTAPLFCPDHQPDALVVTDRYSTGPGETSINFTMYCVGERGDHTDVGWMRPILALMVVHTLLLGALAALLWLRRAARRRRHLPTDAANGVEDLSKV